MTPEQVLQAAIVRDPADDLAWLALADWLEEDGQPDRAELLRLTRTLREVAWTDAVRPGLERRVVELLLAGAEPANPGWVNHVGMRFRLIPPGRFLMGAAAEEPDALRQERPRREVTLTRPYWLAVTPVTQRQYRLLTDASPSYFSASGEGKERVSGLDTADFPVEQVTWHEANHFCEGIPRHPNEKRRRYRLPTEAEWEYACRAGATSTTAYFFGHSLSASQANIGDDPGRVSQVGSYPPNAFGLHDMHGNVREWCADWYDEGYYAHAPASDPPGPGWGDSHVCRGGSWGFDASYARSAWREYNEPSDWSGVLGFRVVLDWGE